MRQEHHREDPESEAADSLYECRSEAYEDKVEVLHQNSTSNPSYETR